MTAAFLALYLGAWPLPADAGRADWAERTNWPAEPGWADDWPLLSFTPAGWSVSPDERDAGVGMSVDRAFSVTQGASGVTIALVNAPVDLTDPLVAPAWRLNAGELPDAGDVNGNGRLDVGDFAADPRVTDLNGNGALDLDDVLRALSDGVDQDQNGRVDDLCGWDFDRDAGVTSAADAGSTARWLAAPVNDGLDPAGVCPGCTIEPWVDARAFSALTASAAQVVVLAPFQAELSSSLLAALQRQTVVLTPASPWTPAPLETHPRVMVVRALTAPGDRTTALADSACGGPTRGAVQASATTCGLEATVRAAGVAGLVLSHQPTLDPSAVEGLISGARIDAFAAVTNAAPSFTHDERRGAAGLTTPRSDAERCLLGRPGSAAVEVPCDGGGSTDDGPADVESHPERAFAEFLERRGASTWVTPLAAPPASARRGLISLRWDTFGSLAPRFVDPDQLEFDVHAFSPLASRLPIAVGLLDADRRLDRVALDDEGHLLAVDVDGRPTGLSDTLASAPADGPVLAQGNTGPVLVTTERSGRVIVRAGTTLTLEAGRPLTRGAAVGPIERDDVLDVAVADGVEVHAWLLDARGPTAASWSQPSRATEVLLADLVGDAALEVIAEHVFDSQGRALLTLDGWEPSPWPAVLTRLDEGRARSLVQLEPRADGLIDLARYDVEQALRAGDSLVARRLISTLRHPPAPGGMAAADFDGDGRPDLLVPTTDGLLFVIGGDGVAAADTPLSTWGAVLTAPTLGVKDSQLQVAVRTTHGDVVTFLARGLVADLTWDGPGHDQSNARNAQTPFHARQLGGLGVPDPPIPPQGCHCGHDASMVLWLAFAVLWRRRPWVASPSVQRLPAPSSPS